MRFKCETHLAIADSIGTAARAINALKSHSLSIQKNEGQHNLIFDDAEVSIRIADRRLFIRVEADDCMNCLGAKMLVEGEIGRHANDMPAQILWIQADSVPFKAIIAIVNGGLPSCGRV